MKIDVQVLSRDMIKPYTPTPNHLQHYKLSYIDQILPVRVSFIYFFHLDQELGRDYISNHLKTSLSKVLTHYYPLAGQIKDNYYVDCNDNGVLFLEAQINCQLSEILQEPFPSDLNEFVPDDIGDVTLAIQVNFFTCGSVVIGVNFPHKLSDATSSITFIKNWAAIARDDTKNVCVEYVGAKLFPPIDVYECKEHVIPSFVADVVSKRFVFNDYFITTLQDKYASKTTTEKQIYPSRNLALASFIWSRFQASVLKKMWPEKSLVLIHGVNLRRRMNQPLSDNSFGNIVQPAFVKCSQDAAKDGYNLVNMFRDSISKIDKNYVEKLQNDCIGNDNFKRLIDISSKEEVVSFTFTNLCRFSTYEADFGWGKPTWVASGRLPHNYAIAFMDTYSGDGIEAWINLKKEDMAKFASDQELLQACVYHD